MSTAPSNSPPPRRQAPRFAFRARSHQSAHADAQVGPDSQLHDHPLACKEPAAIIATADALGDLIGHLRSVGSFAYDSEFIGELTYIPKLCLIQVASSQRVALIDPLAKLDLSPFWNLLTDPSVEKVVHAGLQDIEPVHRLTGKSAANFFDTQIAAGFIGLPYPLSLSKLVGDLVGARLGKGLTFTHWDHRPLTHQQLRYAADDVRYLPAARAQIGQRLSALGHAAWASEESESLCDPSLHEYDHDSQYLKIRGSSTLPRQGLAILRALYIWRDNAARTQDVPPRTMLRDEILLDLARHPVKSAEKLAGIRGLPRPVEAEHGQAIVQATLTALAVPQSELPPQPAAEPTPKDRNRADALWAAAQAISFGQSIDPALVCSRQEIGEFFRRLSSGQDVSELRLMRSWRGEALGSVLVELMAGRRQFHMDWTDGSLLVKGLDDADL